MCVIWKVRWVINQVVDSYGLLCSFDVSKTRWFLSLCLKVI